MEESTGKVITVVVSTLLLLKKMSAKAEAAPLQEEEKPVTAVVQQAPTVKAPTVTTPLNEPVLSVSTPVVTEPVEPVTVKEEPVVPTAQVITPTVPTSTVKELEVVTPTMPPPTVQTQALTTITTPTIPVKMELQSADFFIPLHRIIDRIYVRDKEQAASMGFVPQIITVYTTVMSLLDKRAARKEQAAAQRRAEEMEAFYYQIYNYPFTQNITPPQKGKMLGYIAKNRISESFVPLLEVASEKMNDHTYVTPEVLPIIAKAGYEVVKKHGFISMYPFKDSVPLALAYNIELADFTVITGNIRTITFSKEFMENYPDAPILERSGSEVVGVNAYSKNMWPATPYDYCKSGLCWYEPYVILGYISSVMQGGPQKEVNIYELEQVKT